jgi:glycosyltransferase involved in cell wall biosynthesis
MAEEPLVSVVTPVYNGEPFLAECIESVLKQTYGNFEYIIVNNCSTDRTLDIASDYAKRDGRIRVHSNREFVGLIENHNIALRLISPACKYCKVVSADDWLFPECIQRMVDLAEAHPSVGIIGSYQLSGGGTDWRQWRLNNVNIAYPSEVVPGREACRLQLLGGPYVFGAPTANLYRSDLVRQENAFYPNSTSEADASACYKFLRHADFGFVHQVLSYERVHQIRETSNSVVLYAYLPSGIGDLLTYGSFYLTEIEVKKRLGVLLDSYYTYLAHEFLKLRNRDFWSYHRNKLRELGYPLDKLRLSKAILLTLIGWSLNPKSTVENLLKYTRTR